MSDSPRGRGLVFWEVDSWGHAVTIARRLHGWIFRGQEDTRWHLETHFERLAKRYSLPVDCWKERETDILLQFVREAHHHLNATPGDKDFLEWLSIMQHYGGPTRLLDFTESFYVAVFFALENATSNAGVWAVNRSVLDKCIQDGVVPSKHGVRHTAISARAREIADKCLEGVERGAGILPVQPWRLNERMVAQQGIFLLPTDITESFETNLCQALRLGCTRLPHKQRFGDYRRLLAAVKNESNTLSLIKFRFPRALHSEIMGDLKRMNITSATLYPGLDGFARRFRTEMRLFDGFPQ